MNEKVIAFKNTYHGENSLPLDTWKCSSLGDFVVPNSKGVAPIQTLIFVHFKTFNKNF